MSTKIEWCDETLNPIKMRCTKVSEGCRHCYAERLLSRNLPGLSGYPASGEPPRLDLKELEKPFHWKKPRRIFVESMGDLFHEDVPIEYLKQVLFNMMHCPQHTFMVLTKRPERMADFMCEYHIVRNIWLGVTAENQRTADERIPVLLSIPAAVHFVSVEPMLEKVDLDLCGANYGRDSLNEKTNWVICGAETGMGARCMRPEWALDLLEQCDTAGVPFFFKKWSASNPQSLAMPREYPR